jgi:hypothetical protein
VAYSSRGIFIQRHKVLEISNTPRGLSQAILAGLAGDLCKIVHPKFVEARKGEVRRIRWRRTSENASYATRPFHKEGRASSAPPRPLLNKAQA